MPVRLLFVALALAACADDAPAVSPTPPAGTVAAEAPAAESPGDSLTSVYTDLDLDACETLRVYEEGAGGIDLRCPGYEGVPLFVSEGDLRMDIDAGVPNEQFDTPAGFNTLGETVEWRLRDGAPFAVVIRYRIAGESGTMDDGTSELAVLTVGAEGAPGCLVGWVPATAMPSQNEAARVLADTDGLAGVCAG